MVKRNTANEIIKQKYFEQLKHVDGKAKPTIAQHEHSILKFETFTGFKNFKTFDQMQAIGFKDHLQKSGRSLSTISSTINQVKRFLSWLRTERGYTRSIKTSDIQYLNLSDKDKRAAAAPADKKYPALKLIERVVKAMPYETSIEKRDRALVAFTAITGIRDGATISLKLKHIDIDRMLVLQNPKEVTTKASKRIDTFIFPISDMLETIFLDWLEHLKEDLAFADTDPLFPATNVGQDEDHCFSVIGLSKEHWTTASQMRKVFKDAFNAVGEENYGPHSFRNMIVSQAYDKKLTHAELKAWSQNLGHEGLLVTLKSYGKLSVEEQGRLIRYDKEANEAPLTRSELDKILRKKGL